jgi:hypothetical protein
MSLAISKQGSATPGEYAKDKSLCVAYFGNYLNFSRVGFAWYNNASLLYFLSIFLDFILAHKDRRLGLKVSFILFSFKKNR